MKTREFKSVQSFKKWLEQNLPYGEHYELHRDSLNDSYNLLAGHCYGNMQYVDWADDRIEIKGRYVYTYGVIHHRHMKAA